MEKIKEIVDKIIEEHEKTIYYDEGDIEQLRLNIEKEIYKLINEQDKK